MCLSEGMTLAHRHKKMTMNQELLVGLNYEDHLERGIEGGTLVEYSIFSNHSLPEGQGSALIIGWEESTIHAWNHENQHVNFIRSVFERLDPLLDLDFVEGDSSGNSDINIHRSWYNSWYDKGESLNNNNSHNGRGGGTAHFDYDHIDISWIDSYRSDLFTDAERMTIVHEIGHAIGLIDLAYDQRWDTYDSIMSYNHPENLPIQTWFTDADIAAMQGIWGVEANQDPALTETKGVLANGTEDTQYTFAKSTLLQGFTDIDSTTLNISSARSSAGTLSDNGNGTFTLMPPNDFSGTITLSYEVIDGDGGSVTSSNSVYFNDVPDGIVRQGTASNDRLIGIKGDDTLLGYGGSDKIRGQRGDDVIDAGPHGSKADKVKGGLGSDTFIIKEGYLTDIKDFNIVDDVLDLNGLANGLDWDYQDGKTYIRGEDGYEVARFKGYKNLDQANLV